MSDDVSDPIIHEMKDSMITQAPTTEPSPDEIRLAAALHLAVRNAHPVYPSSATWHGGAGGQAITQGCSFIDPPPSAGWVEFLLDEFYDWARAHPDVHLNAAVDDLHRELSERAGVKRSEQ